MSRRIFATESELHAALDPTLATAIWTAAAPATDSEGRVTPSTDPIWAGAYAAADGDLPAELNITKALTKLDQLRAELKKVK